MAERLPDRRALNVGDRLEMGSGGPAEIREVRQRNWSRIAVAHRDGERLFVKQFVDRIGHWQQRGFAGDAETAELLGDEIVGVRVLPVIHRDPDRLITVARYIEMDTIDSLRGKDRQRSREVAAQIGKALAAVIEERTVADQPDTVDVWKGLDPKNLGVGRDGTVYIFDFGPPARTSRTAAAAAAVSAGLLSQWVAHPGLHLVAPERHVLRKVCEPIAPMTTVDAVLESLARHRELRLREPQRDGLAGIATRLGVRTVGSIYWRVAETEARRLFPQA